MNSLPLNSVPTSPAPSMPSVATPSLDDVLAEIEQKMAQGEKPLQPVTPPAAPSLQVESPLQSSLTGLLTANTPLEAVKPSDAPLQGESVTAAVATPPAPLQLSEANDSPTFEEHARALTQSNLTERQKALPKLELSKMVGAVLMAIVLTVAVSSSVYVTQQSQDLRQQAYEGSEIVLPDGSVHKPNVIANTEQAQKVITARTPKVTSYGTMIIIGAAVVITLLLIWLFWA